MPLREDAPTGAPCWIDLLTSDKEAAKAFYTGLFGWTAEEAGEEYGGYVNFLLDGVPVAGCMAGDGSAGPDRWTVYLATDDVAATAEAATAAGGQVLMPPMPVMELGNMAVVADPAQAAIGVWQPGLHRGFGVIDETGAPSWFELHTRGYDDAVAFYRQVFGWDAHTMSDTPEFRYTTLGGPEDQLAGIMDASAFLPDGVPSYWTMYIDVDDADAAVARVGELGGSVVAPAEDTPYGRIATVADTTGAQFRLRATS